MNHGATQGVVASPYHLWLPSDPPAWAKLSPGRLHGFELRNRMDCFGTTAKYTKEIRSLFLGMSPTARTHLPSNAIRCCGRIEILRGGSNQLRE